MKLKLKKNSDNNSKSFGDHHKPKLIWLDPIVCCIQGLFFYFNGTQHLTPRLPINLSLFRPGEAFNASFAATVTGRSFTEKNIPSQTMNTYPST